MSAVYKLKHDIVIPAGSEFTPNDELGAGGADTVLLDGGTRVFMSIQWGVDDGLLEPDSTPQ